MNINIKNTTKTILVLLSAFVFSPLYAADGDVFTAKTVEGVDMTFMVISETEKTCQVGEGVYKSAAILSSTTGLVTIPNSTNGYSVTSIGSSAFYGYWYLTSIKVDGNNKVYDSRDNCNAIIETSHKTLITGCKNTFIPNSVISIGEYAFLNCSGLTSITIPNSVISIGDDAFWGCSGLTSITIPNSVTSIGSSAFYNCSGLTSITIPNSVISIGDGAFSDCSGLTSIKVDGNNKVYDSRDNCNAIIETASNTMIAGCMNAIIPNSVISIGDDAFWGCSGLTSITIPNSVISIGDYAFWGCSGLTSITIPNSVTSIGFCAFYGCSGLTSIISFIKEPFTISESYIPSSTTTKATLSIPCGRKALYEQTGGWKDFTNIVERDRGVGDVFTAKTDENINISFMVTDMERKLCQVTSGLVGKAAIDIRTEGLLAIPSTAEGYTVTSIGSGAIAGCSGLTSISIPNSVISIGESAFSGCNGLTTIISYIKNPFAVNDNVFSSSTKTNATLSVPYGKGKLYEQTDGWKEFANIVEQEPMDIGDVFTAKTDENIEMRFMITDVERKTCRVTSGSDSETAIGITTEGTLTIPSIVRGYTVTEIDKAAFKGCESLTSVFIPSTITAIGDEAFVGCSGLASIVVDSENKVYDSRDNCNAIIEVATNTLMVGCQNTVIPSTVTAIGERACYGVLGLTAITLPATLRSIGDEAFANTDNLAHVTSEITEPFAIPATAFVHSNGEVPTLYIPKNISLQRAGANLGR